MGNPTWRFEGNEIKYLRQVIETGFRAGADGSFNERLEEKWNLLHKSKFSITSNSCTSSLHAGLLALGCGPGDEVLVPSLTPLMCGLTIHYTGATPVYVDSLIDTFLMDPVDLESKITSKTKAIKVVHMYGGVCNIEKIMEISKKYNIPVVEDCAQGLWGNDHRGVVTGTSGDISTFSFENSKQLTSGDGGMATTNDENLAQKIRQIGGLGFKNITASTGKIRIDRDLFQNPDWERFESIGYNFRMSELCAAVALAQAEQIDKYIDLRRSMGEAYRKVTENSELVSAQHQPKGYKYTYYTFSMLFKGSHHGIKWKDFRKKHVENGGDGFFSAAKLLYQEPAFRNNKIGRCITPNSEFLQQNLMNLTTNQANKDEIDIQSEALMKTLKYFGDKTHG